MKRADERLVISRRAPGAPSGRSRYLLLDALRGLCVISMTAYHGMYDLVVLKGYPVPWYGGWQGYVWQQSICWTFIFLSGLCWNLSRRHVFRGLVLVACATAVTLVTWLAMPSQLILYGILTLLGLSALLLNLLHLLFERVFRLRIPPAAGFAGAFLLFLLLRGVPRGYLGFEGLRLVTLPGALYRWDLLAVLGFHSPGFHSSDYFPLIPWFFLYLSGYFFWGVLSARQSVLFALRGTQRPALAAVLRPFCFIGRHALLIYLAHQLVLMLVFLPVPVYGG